MRWKVGFQDLKTNGASGIRVYYFYDSGGTTHICGVGFRIGSVHDPAMANGIAHFAEHLVSRETMAISMDNVDRLIWRYLGGYDGLKIETSRTSTYFGGPGLLYKKYMNLVMPMFVGLVRDRLITKAGMNTEKGAVNNEFILTEEDVAFEKLDIIFLQAMYQTNPIRYSILGAPADFNAITADKVRRFVRKFYVAQNMFAIVFGPKRDDAVAFARKYLDDWPHSGSPAEIDLSGFDITPKIKEPRIMEIPKAGLGAYYIQIGFPTECYSSNDDAALDVIAEIIMRRLLTILREDNQDPNKGVYRSRSFTERTFLHGVIGNWFSTIDKDYARYGQEQTIKEFLRFREELVSKLEVSEAIDALRERFLMQFRDSPEEVVDLVIHAASNNDPDLTRLHAYPDRLSRVTSRKIRDVANKYFSPNGFACAMLSPA